MQPLLEVHYFFGSRIGKLTYYLKGDEDVQWEQCKKKLAEIISLKCRGFGTVKKVIYKYISLHRQSAKLMPNNLGSQESWF